MLKLSQRAQWSKYRLWQESQFVKFQPDGERHYHRWEVFRILLFFFGFLTRILGMYSRGKRNAENLELIHYDVPLKTLPKEFHGYKLLQISDVHFDALPGGARRIAELASDLDFDLCCFTGDYCKYPTADQDYILSEFQIILDALKPRDGFTAILGNHDPVSLVEKMEDIGIRVLCNESQVLERSGKLVQVTGLDDVYQFYSEYAEKALEEQAAACKIALIHSADTHELASRCGYDFYLCGHTHGGQICLPNRKPLITHLTVGKEYASGFWRSGEMTGFTSRGVGTTGLPLRFNCPPELALHHLQTVAE